MAAGSPTFPGVDDGNAPPSSPPPQLARVAEVFGTFASLGVTSFGGPAAHLAHFRERCVHRLRWIDDTHYAQLVAFCHSLPGPTSSQAGFLLGWLRAGPAGALAAWVAFTAPSAAVMIALAIALSSNADLSASGWIAGMKAIVPAVVMHAVAGMARTLCRGAARVAIAIAAGSITLVWSHPIEQLVAIAAGAILGAICLRSDVRRQGADAHPLRISPAAALSCVALLAAALPAGLFAFGSHMAPYMSAGALVFGGGHVVLPLLEADLVPNIIDQSRFLAGYGAAQAMPGPLFTIASYLGAASSVRAGDAAGTAATWGIAATLSIFAPGLLLAACVWPAWTSLSRLGGAMRALAGVQAAVTGLLAGALIETVVPAAVAPDGRADLWLCAIAALAVAALRWGAPTWIVTVGGSLLGAALGALR